MTRIQRLFQKYTGFLRSLKAAYVANNLLNAKQLRHNRNLYRSYGLKKSIFSPLGYTDFEKAGHHADIPWLDRPERLETMEQNAEFHGFTPELRDKVRQFEREGFCILEGFFAAPEIEQLNAEVERLLSEGKAGFNFTGRKIFNLWEISQLAKDHFFRNPELLKFLGFLLGKPALPFQSLNFTRGSEQRAHSDSIHMTTEPPGYLIATWIALEDVTEDSGPLVYYPGSHRLPFVSTADYDSGNGYFTLGHDSNRHYEDKIAGLIAENNLEKKVFLPRRGDVLIWHGNLLHGGSPITRTGATRKSMVCHYFAEGVICYHEMSQRPALMPQ